MNTQRIFDYFNEISAIPRGSGNMTAISEYCINFAKTHGLDYYTDDAKNVVIYKKGTKGTEPIILQGHLDIVCQKTPERVIDFEREGIDLYIEDGFIKANGTTLGADNGIAVAMILAILESDDIEHPPIEAVFTTDEEIGMIGATALDMSKLSGARMINLDAEEDDAVTVSCAGGSDFNVTFPVCRKSAEGTLVTVTLRGLLGGHSGVEIDKGRVNSNILAGRLLNHLSTPFEILSVDGGDKGNAIPLRTVITLCTPDAKTLAYAVSEYLDIVKREIAERENGFVYDIEIGESGEYSVLDNKDDVIYTLCCAPNGVMEMSAGVKGLVETSLNLGILKTDADAVTFHFSLRSNINSALYALEERLVTFFSRMRCDVNAFGHYPSWEYRDDSPLRALFVEKYTKLHGRAPKVEAIHAGLECGVFASAKQDFDCIAIGPALFDVHTVSERLDIESTKRVYKLLVSMLEEL